MPQVQRRPSSTDSESGPTSFSQRISAYHIFALVNFVTETGVCLKPRAISKAIQKNGTKSRILIGTAIETTMIRANSGTESEDTFNYRDMQVNKFILRARSQDLRGFIARNIDCYRLPYLTCAVRSRKNKSTSRRRAPSGGFYKIRGQKSPMQSQT
ncbi:hypothetical protein EVAR_55934_1 [Eumeta japonica]|uniref:Uncharacterized protein n=1 Tax=Eumeta variegata TaxID=151549 RepID=A0A4C1YUZ1_EUMVA|nr:hypothetical protein EVAR_55934_1 [Eumeta japonica]